MAKDRTAYSDLDDFPVVQVIPDAAPDTAELYAANVLTVARSYVGRRELPGNRGPFVSMLLTFTEWTQGPAPWCAAFVVYVLHQAAAELGLVSTCPKHWKHAIGAARLWRFARAHPELCEMIYDDRDLRPGDVVVMGRDADDAIAIRNGRLRKGHVYLAATLCRGSYGWHGSIEGNTNAKGSRDGDRVAEKFDERAFHDLRTVGGIRFFARRA